MGSWGEGGLWWTCSWKAGVKGFQFQNGSQNWSVPRVGRNPLLDQGLPK